MKTRCLNPKHNSYVDYGAKGIKVCDRWLEFENFLTDMGERPEGMTLDREKPTDNYEPGKCRWATAKDQSMNRSNVTLYNVGGKPGTLKDLCEFHGVPYRRITARVYNRGKSVDEAFGFPVEQL